MTNVSEASFSANDYPAASIPLSFTKAARLSRFIVSSLQGREVHSLFSVFARRPAGDLCR